MSTDEILPIKYGIRPYIWGKPGNRSLVGKLTGDDKTTEPRAELWVGTHPTLPSSVNVKGDWIPLLSYINESPSERLGSHVYKKFGSDLPFLFKILSVNNCLSVQAHPDKKWAKRLHAERPHLYPDDNHKLEAAIALTEVHLLYGFKEADEIISDLRNYPKLLSFLEIDSSPIFIRRCFEKIFKGDSSLLEDAIDEVEKILRSKSNPTPPEILFLDSLNRYTKEDRGLATIFLMTYEIVQPGEVFFNPTTVLHAYVSGDLVECLTTSDNVIRSALTPKPKDIEALFDVVEFSPRRLKLYKGVEEPASGFERFDLPVEEFVVSRLKGLKQSSVSPASIEVLFSVDAIGNIEYMGNILEILPGNAFVVSASVKKYEIVLKEGTLYRSSVPT